MRFLKKTAAAAVVVSAFLLAACGGTKTDTPQREPKETEKSGVEEMISALKGEETKNPMEGDGRAQTEIGTAEELVQFRDRVNGGEAALDAVLTADIDLSSVCGEGVGDWIPFEEYNGVFDGDGHEISGLCIAGEDSDSGALFKKIGFTGVVKNLEITGARIQVTSTAAALAMRNEGTVENCSSRDGYIKGYEAYGLLGESMEESTVSGCHVSGTVEGGGRAAGIVGFLYGAAVSDCYNEAAVSTEKQQEWAAGISCSASTSQITDCCNGGAVTGAWDTAGVVGTAAKGSVITGCYNTAAISGKGRVSGIAAMMGESVLNRCYNMGPVSGVNGTAGILATTKGSTPQSKCVVANCFNRGEISADQLCAGVALGANCVTVNSYNLGSVISGNGGIYGAAGVSDRGGIMSGDQVETFLLSSYSAGTLSEKAGGLTYSDTMTEMNNVFYQDDTAAGYYFNRKDGGQDASHAVSAEQFASGEVLEQLNAYVDSGAALPEGCAKAAEAVTLDHWKAGNDGYPALEWE